MACRNSKRPERQARCSREFQDMSEKADALWSAGVPAGSLRHRRKSTRRTRARFPKDIAAENTHRASKTAPARLFFWQTLPWKNAASNCCSPTVRMRDHRATKMQNLRKAPKSATCHANPQRLLGRSRRRALCERETFSFLAAYGAFLDVVFAFAVSHRPAPDTSGVRLPSCFAGFSKKCSRKGAKTQRLRRAWFSLRLGVFA